MITDYMIILLKSIICIPLFFFIPGFLTNSIYTYKKSLKFDSSLILQIFVSIIITSFTGLILAQLGLYSLFNLVILLVLASIILFQKYKKLPGKTKFNLTIVFNWKNIIIIILILSSVLLFFHPFPWIAGGRDPGVYVSAGVHIANSGSIFIKDPLIAQMNTSIQDILYDVEPASVYGFISWANMNSKFQFPGFYITDLSSGTITPQFLHMFPIWIAIFYSIFGLFGAFFVNPVFGLLSICALYLLGKKLFSWKVGALAGFILILNFAQIWYARYPFSEILTQFFILSGILTFVQFNETSNRYIGVISALLFGLAILTKIETLLLLIPLGLFYFYLIIRKKWNISHFYFIAPLFIVLIYSSIDYLFYTKPYISQLIQIAIDPPSIGQDITKYNDPFMNYKMFSWYATKLGLLLSFIGLGIILITKKKKETLFLAFIGLMFSFLYLSKITISPDHPWWARRLVPIIFPFYAIFASYALIEGTKIKKFGKHIFFALTAFLLISLAATSYPILTHSEGYGMTDGASKISEYFKENDIILMGPSFEGAELSTPLYYIYDKNVIYLSRFNPFPQYGYREMPTQENVSIGIDYLLDQGHEVYLISNSNNIYMDKLLYILSTNHKIDLIDSMEFSYRHLESTIDSMPAVKTDVHMRLTIYKVSYGKNDLFNITNFSLDIGSPIDGIYLETGFYGQEKWDNITNRWTSGNASIRIPTPEKKDLLISISAGGFRPGKNIPPANVSIYLNENLIKNFTSNGEYEEHNMTVVKDYLTAPFSTLQIRTNTWRPSEYIGTSDTRDLGINIDKISVVQSG